MDPMHRKMVLASLGSPQNSHKFDHGVSKLEIDYEDEIEREDFEVVELRRTSDA
jgi:hypothetical protein